MPCDTVAAMKIIHAGLRRLYERDDAKRLNPAHVRRIRRILTDLDVARSPRNMDAPEYRLHPLKGAGAADGSCGSAPIGGSCSASRTSRRSTWISPTTTERRLPHAHA